MLAENQVKANWTLNWKYCEKYNWIYAKIHSRFILLRHSLCYTIKKYEIKICKFSREIIKKINLSQSRPGQALRAPGISRHSVHEGGKVVSRTYRPPLFISVSAARRIQSMKYPNDHIGNRTRDLPPCSAVPQPTAPPSNSTISNSDTYLTDC
jgi:hypothetical protein